MDISKVILLSDMDGTLLNSKKQINDIDRRAIERFIGLGGKFTVATGRTIQSFEQYTKLLELKMPVIMYNGGAIYDYQKQKVMYSHPLPDTVKEMTAEILRLMPESGGEVLTLDNTYVFNNTEYQQLHTKLCGITPLYTELSEIPVTGWLKVLFSLAPENVGKLHLLVKQLGFDEHVDFVKSSEIFLEVLPKGISKGSALEAYRKLEGMEDHTFVSIGDFDNDIEMVKAADIGACPSNAQESVKNAADIVLEHTNDEGAVAELIEYIVTLSTT